ncbi:hydroxyisourate hydrolase [Streptomyces sp. SCSIO ZS0520]|uniref:hydroxyisourate hydrolase n=1 Tax=Streptomyces sp. SCSIO ZS0520 TaxID=2892996 RepID=UPI0021D8EDDA|nr:hydroxyisourate hydrolase [Streptomyces sp. SCSIO ZS0520]
MSEQQHPGAETAASSEPPAAPLTPTTVSTHVLDTAAGRPAEGIPVALSAQAADGSWRAVGDSRTDGDGRCRELPPLPPGTGAARLDFTTGPYLGGPDPEAPAGFFPEVTVTFEVRPGEHFHVPLLLSRFGYSVYRGS